ncbi:MAG: PKD domain-containing protein [Pseudomonadales bacterium]|uniref:PKD domain-containing protein n=1 Tax=Alcanivorax profundi TaxID=2338368 RepID=UPI0024397731|nr:PKD domain-containing protein [Pseudomonadales bacterium]
MIRLIGCSLFSACLAISGCGGGGGGESSSPAAPDKVNTAPVANAGPLQNVKTGDVVTLDGSGSHDADGDALTYHWTFIAVPASSSTVLVSPNTPKPHFTADQSGQYELTLEVNDGQTNSEIATVSVTATTSNSAPVAHAGPDQAVTTGSQVQLDGRQSSDADGDALTYQWSFSSKPAGSLASLVMANNAQPAFTPDIDGEYLLALIVNDGTVDSIADEARILASTANSRPIAHAGADRNTITGETVTLDGGLSQDADGDTLSYLWAFVSKPESSTAALTGPNLSTPSFITDIAGDYVLSLTVNDGQEDSETDNVTVTATQANSVPVASAGVNQAVLTGETVNLNGSASQDLDNDPLTYHWQILSRPEGSKASLSNDGAISPVFTADLSGQYRIGLIVNDGKVDSPMAEITVTATRANTIPSANAGADQSVHTGDTVTLSGASSHDDDGDSLSYQWAFASYPDGSSAILTGTDSVAASFDVDLVGNYVVELVVSDGVDQSPADQVTITATKANTAPTALVGNNQTVIAGHQVNLDGSGSYDTDGDTLSYQWQFVDKPPASLAALSDTRIAAPSFTADFPGEYTLNLTVSDGAASAIGQVVITATPKEYTLSYSPGPGGTLTGDTHQIVQEGNNGSLVTAVPDTGFSFFQWNDGLTNPARTDLDIDQDLTLSAQFKTSLTRPENLTVNTGDGQLIVSWDHVSDASGYNLYYATEAGVTPSNYQDLQGGIKASFTGSPATLSELVNGETYYLVVTATLAAAESEASQEVSGIPAIPIIPWKESLHEGDLDIQIESPKEAMVNWPDNTGSTYNLYITQDPDIDLDNYAAYGATLVADASSGYALSDLSIRKPYYVALKENGKFVAWTRFQTGAWGIDERISAQAMGADGTRYIAGNFTSIGIAIGGGDAFPTSSNPHPLGMPRVNGPVSAVAADGFGGWYIGGRFTSVDGKPRNNLAHINSKGLLTNWAPEIRSSVAGISSSVGAIAVDQGTLYIGGDFDKVNGQDRHNLASFTAYYQTADDSWYFSGALQNWQPEVSGTSVDAIAILGNRIYIAMPHPNGIVAYDKHKNVSSWAANSDGPVKTLLAAHDRLYVGGAFNEIQGHERKKLAAFDSNGQLTAWSPNVDGSSVRSLVVHDHQIYLGGDFTHVGGTARSNIASVDLDGNVTSWSPTTDDDVYAITTNEDGTLYLAGAFNHVNGIARSHTAAIDTNGALTPWKVDLGRGYSTGISSARTLLIQKGTIYIGGNFAQLGLHSRGGLAAFDEEENLTQWSPSLTGEKASTIAIGDSQVYLGGKFTQIDQLERHNLAAVDFSGNVTAWSPTTNDEIRVLRYQDGIIYAAGLFSSANDTERTRLAAFDDQGTLTDWAPEVNSPATSMEISGNRIYLGGGFTQVNNQNLKYLAALDTSGELTSWRPSVNNRVQTLAIEEGTIYAGGSFTYAFPEDRNGLAAFDLSGTLTPWNPNITDYAGANPSAIAVSDNEIYISGGFSEINGIPLQTCCLASFRLNGSLTDWRPQPDPYGLASSILLGNGNIYLGGDFTELGGQIRAGMAVFSEETGKLLDH